MLPEDHPRRSDFQALTKAAEAIGLFEDSTRIGFREQWLRLVREKGYQIVGHELIPIANDEATVQVRFQNREQFGRARRSC